MQALAQTSTAIAVTAIAAIDPSFARDALLTSFSRCLTRTRSGERDIVRGVGRDTSPPCERPESAKRPEDPVVLLSQIADADLLPMIQLLALALGALAVWWIGRRKPPPS
jgi:hypothetical protein